jgi:preprotein translocase subunit SecG
MDSIYVFIIIFLLILLVLYNNTRNNTRNNKNQEININNKIEKIDNIENNINYKTSSDKLKEEALNVNTNNNNYILDSNSISPYAVSYSSFYYDHNKDPYEDIYTNKVWLYEPWIINKKYI